MNLTVNELQSKVRGIISQTQLSSDLESSLRTFSFIQEEQKSISDVNSNSQTDITSKSQTGLSKNELSKNQNSNLNSNLNLVNDSRTPLNMSHLILDTIESSQIATFEKILQFYEPFKEKSIKLKNDIEHISKSLEELDLQFINYDKETKEYVSSLNDLQSQYETTKKEIDEVVSFLKDYQLSPEEMATLSQGEISTRNQASFFKVLLKVYDIKEKATTFITSQIQTPRACIEVIEEMSMYQDSALLRLSEWIQEKCKIMRHEDNVDSLQSEEELKQMVKILSTRSILLMHCTSEIENARAQILIQEFKSFISQKNSSALQSSEIINHVGDILAWTHQLAASERDLVDSILGIDATLKPIERSENIINTSNAHTQQHLFENEVASFNMLQDISKKMLYEMFIGVSKQLEQRVERITFATEQKFEVQDYFRISHLCELYSSKISKVLKGDSSLSRDLLRLRDLSMVYFFDVLQKDVVSLFEEEATQIPLNLAPPLVLMETLQIFHELMGMFIHSIAPEEKKEEEFSIILKKGLLPIIEHIRKISLTSNQRIHQCIFLLNSLLLIQKELHLFTFTSSTVNTLEVELDELTDEIIHLETQNLSQKFSFETILGKISSPTTPEVSQSIETENSKILSSLVPEETIRICIQSFYQLLFSMGPEGLLDTTILKRISNTKVKGYIFSCVLKNLTVYYAKIYEAVLHEQSGYQNPSEIVYHSPEQVRQLLQII